METESEIIRESEAWTEIEGPIPSDLTEFILNDMTPGQQFIIQVSIYLTFL